MHVPLGAARCLNAHARHNGPHRGEKAFSHGRRRYRGGRRHVFSYGRLEDSRFPDRTSTCVAPRNLARELFHLPQRVGISSLSLSLSLFPFFSTRVRLRARRIPRTNRSGARKPTMEIASGTRAHKGILPERISRFAAPGFRCIRDLAMRLRQTRGKERRRTDGTEGSTVVKAAAHRRSPPAGLERYSREEKRRSSKTGTIRRVGGRGGRREKATGIYGCVLLVKYGTP
jgi:hypothetical protein